MCLFIHNWEEFLEDCERADEVVEPFPIAAEPFRVLKKSEVVLPSAQFATELGNGSTSVYDRLFPEKVVGGLSAIQDNEDLPEG
jgi:hypothetical protein